MTILNHRLSKILKDNTILKSSNYTSLLEKSTFELIQILNNLTEYARENKKQLWTFFQDMEKTFDTVSLEMLELAMHHIRMSKVIVNLVIGIFCN